jgi:hypothetical protein
MIGAELWSSGVDLGMEILRGCNLTIDTLRRPIAYLVAPVAS